MNVILSSVMNVINVALLDLSFSLDWTLPPYTHTPRTPVGSGMERITLSCLTL